MFIDLFAMALNCLPGKKLRFSGFCIRYITLIFMAVDIAFLKEAQAPGLFPSRVSPE